MLVQQEAWIFQGKGRGLQWLRLEQWNYSQPMKVWNNCLCHKRTRLEKWEICSRSQRMITHSVANKKKDHLRVYSIIALSLLVWIWTQIAKTSKDNLKSTFLNGDKNSLM